MAPSLHSAGRPSLDLMFRAADAADALQRSVACSLALLLAVGVLLWIWRSREDASSGDQNKSQVAQQQTAHPRPRIPTTHCKPSSSSSSRSPFSEESSNQPTVKLLPTSARSCIACCWARPTAAEDPSSPPAYPGKHPSQSQGAPQQNETGSSDSIRETFLQAGVPCENVDVVQELFERLQESLPSPSSNSDFKTSNNSQRLGDGEPLMDPTTLWRFANSREFKLEAAVDMHKDALEWRRSFDMRALMETFGKGEHYSAAGLRTSSDGTEWLWLPSTEGNAEVEFVRKYGFWGRLQARAPADQAPIAVWRVGKLDVGQYASKPNALETIKRGFASHLEDLFQCGRAQSRKDGKIVRARLILDCAGLNVSSTLSALKTVKPLMDLGKQFFPETTASITVINAPGSFALLYRAVKPFLTPVMKRKVCILGSKWKDGLKSHTGLEIKSLPEYLGGLANDDEVCAADPIPADVDGPY